MSIDLNRPEMVGYMSPHAEWKRELIRDFGRRFSIRAFIETGTCWGTTVGAVAECFDEISTVEIEESFYKFASKKYAYTGAKFYFGSSSEKLPAMIQNTTRRPILFWLDAHITGGTTINLGDQIAGELKAIDEFAPDSVVLIDDVKPGEKGGSFDGPDAPIVLLPDWHGFFYNGVLALQKSLDNGGIRYKFPLTF